MESPPILEGEKASSLDNIRDRIRTLVDEIQVLDKQSAEDDVKLRAVWNELRRLVDHSPTQSHGVVPSHAEEETVAAKQEATGTAGIRITPQLNAVPWGAFQACLGKKEQFAIDVLIGPPKTGPPTPVPCPSKPASEVGNNSGQEPLPERIRINSKAIISLLSRIHESAISPDWKPVIFFRPFRLLLYYEEKIRACVEKIQGNGTGDIDVDIVDDEYISHPDSRDELQCLIHFIDTYLHPKMSHLRGPGCREVTFSDLWLLFRPGDHVLSQNERHCYRVLYVYPQLPPGRVQELPLQSTTPPHALPPFSLPQVSPPLSPPTTAQGLPMVKRDAIGVGVVLVDFDGEQIGPAVGEFIFAKFYGRKEIASFPIHPARLSEKPELRKDFIEKGKLFLRAAGLEAMHYRGPTLEIISDNLDDTVIIDFKEALRANRNMSSLWKPKVVHLFAVDQVDRMEPIADASVSEAIHSDSYVETWRRRDFVQSQLSSKLSLAAKLQTLDQIQVSAVPDDDLLIVSRRLFGYILRKKRFSAFDLAYLKPLEYDFSLDFSRLVLPSGHQDTITGLVEGHVAVKRPRRALALHLHGMPGVGKGTTARCVANRFKKLLLDISPRDVVNMYSSDDSKRELGHYFRLTERWGCFLLLRNADTHVESQMGRSFVSTLTRPLNEFSGVVFLTSNSARSMDETVRPYIQLSFFYPPLDRTGTLSIFENHIERLIEEVKLRQQHIKVDRDSILSFATAYWERHHESRRWNAREISNAFDVALTLAEIDARKPEPGPSGTAVTKLSAAHFEPIADSFLVFGAMVPPAPRPNAPGAATFIRPDFATRNSSSESENSFGSDDEARLGPDQHRPRMLRQLAMDPSLGAAGHQLREKKHRRRVKRPAKPVSYALTDTLFLTTKPGLIRIKWDGFKEGRKRGEKDRFAIDVLEGEPAVDFDMDEIASIWWSRWANRQAKDNDGTTVTDAEDRDSAKGSVLARGQRQLPERIRIHAKQLVDILSQVHGSNMSPYNASLVMVRPFRALAYYERALRQKLMELSTESSASGTDEHKSEDGDEPPPIPSYEYLQCLVDFIDTEITAKVEYLRNGPCQRVAFSDLWHMFKPGDEVIGQGGRQAYRILSVASTCHKVVPPWETWESRKRGEEVSSGPSVTLHCVHVDFDGKRLGPVSTKIDIGHFEGEKLVTSLPVYPLRFTEGLVAGDGDRGKETSFRNKLISRGRLFVDVIAVKPMYYKGLTLDTEDEVDSQVVIDFEEAFAVANSKDWEMWPDPPPLEELVGTSIGESREDEPCTATCCSGEEVHQDAYAERKRNEEYISTLIPDPDDKSQEPSVAVFPRPLQENILEELSDEDLVIMSHRVYGYILRNRRWARLDLRYLSPIGSKGTSWSRESSNEQPIQGLVTSQGLSSLEEGDNSTAGDASKEDSTVPETDTAFDQLVLPDGHKEIVVSLISQYFQDRDSRKAENEEADIVRGKGKGLIILLHGAPGVGKTTTAEGVAEVFNKPLLQITCGDLGVTAEQVETALERHFSLASRWGCVLLLDEADVFLAERSPQDFKRNSFVAVFLRVLEYYAGILFLTTNRIGDFDEAFASRIHISLYYPPLGYEPTVRIFELNLKLIRERIQRKGVEIDIDEASILKFATDYWNTHEKMRWNGRQIRNACQTALALAEYDSQRGLLGKVIDAKAAVKREVDVTAKIHLTVAHLEIVSKAYLEFMKYLKEVHGQHAERRAKHMGIRARESVQYGEGRKSRAQDVEEGHDGKQKGLGKGPISQEAAQPTPSTSTAYQPYQGPQQTHLSPAIPQTQDLHTSSQLSPPAPPSPYAIPGVFNPYLYQQFQPGYPQAHQHLTVPGGVYPQVPVSAVDQRQAIAAQAAWLMAGASPSPGTAGPGQPQQPMAAFPHSQTTAVPAGQSQQLPAGYPHPQASPAAGGGGGGGGGGMFPGMMQVPSQVQQQQMPQQQQMQQQQQVQHQQQGYPGLGGSVGMGGYQGVEDGPSSG